VYRVHNLGSKVYGSGFSKGYKFRVLGLWGVRVSILGLGVQGLQLFRLRVSRLWFGVRS